MVELLSNRLNFKAFESTSSRNEGLRWYHGRLDLRNSLTHQLKHFDCKTLHHVLLERLYKMPLINCFCVVKEDKRAYSCYESSSLFKQPTI
jgi:hypothetical protein